jgi:TFIIF-interacting CTD phosphatase-like protein
MNSPVHTCRKLQSSTYPIKKCSETASLHYHKRSQTIVQEIRTTSESQCTNNPFFKKTKKEYCVSSAFIPSLEGDDPLEVSLHEFHITPIQDEKERACLKDITEDSLEEIGKYLEIQNLMTEELEINLKLIAVLSSPSPRELLLKSIKIPKPKRYRKTIVLDLDETLIHSFNYLMCNDTYKGSPVSMLTSFKEKYSSFIQFIKRPYLHEFLEALSQDFELIVIM